ncbi:DNA repair protein RadC [Heyndrickxia sporothermodurans]|uniref:JAB domain-containing protein n=1 Tax=Heyndrickxia sporothermodurans TaxID=46224 RepID=UPI002DBDA7B5|nr:JAB domain-containing protein [Heyndrickxia sporothermodurans]MEB6550156.1 DNA repair protein RadC [Heyndrickxia sporothermodurans]
MENIFEIVRIKQIVKETDMKRKTIRSPEEAAEIAAEFIGDEDREVFLVMCLNTKNEVIAVNRCHIGSINMSVVHPREVVKVAFLNNSTSLIVAHNHPSYNCEPSSEDIQMTRRLVEVGEIVGVPILDSLIVSGNGNYTSLKEKGYIK